MRLHDMKRHENGKLLRTIWEHKEKNKKEDKRYCSLWKVKTLHSYYQKFQIHVRHPKCLIPKYFSIIYFKFDRPSIIFENFHNILNKDFIHMFVVIMLVSSPNHFCDLNNLIKFSIFFFCFFKFTYFFLKNFQICLLWYSKKFPEKGIQYWLQQNNLMNFPFWEITLSYFYDMNDLTS
jgi:hypothetical protein